MLPHFSPFCRRPSPHADARAALFPRILLGEVEDIQHLFMVPGHTKNLLDGRFGVAKHRCRDVTAYSSQELLDALNELENDTFEWVTIADMLHWKSVLGKFFVRRLPDISTFHSFHFSSQWPGKVECRRREGDPPVMEELLLPEYRARAHPDEFPHLPDVEQSGVKDRRMDPLRQCGLSQRAYNTLRKSVLPLIPPQYREELCGRNIPVHREEERGEEQMHPT